MVPLHIRSLQSYTLRVDIGPGQSLCPSGIRIRAGFVVGMTASDPGSQEIKEVVDIPEEGPYLTPGLWLFIRWVADSHASHRAGADRASSRLGQEIASLGNPDSGWSGVVWRCGKQSAPDPPRESFIKAGVMTLGELDDLIGANGRKEALKN